MFSYNWLETLNISEEMLQGKNKQRLPVIWISAQECTGCVEAFITSEMPSAEDTIFKIISLEASELLSASAGEQFEHHKESIYEKYKGEYVLVVEGSIPMDDQFLMVAGNSVKEEIIAAAKHAKAVLAFGSCSSWGGIAAAEPNPTGAVAVTELLSEETPLALVPGCPPIADVMTGTLAHLHYHNELPELDKKGRPKAFYSTSVHNACPRKPYFLNKQFAETYDDEGASLGYCLFKLGCKGPTTFNACETIGWNGGGCSPITSGNACIGCSEKDFWDKGSLCSLKKKKRS